MLIFNEQQSGTASSGTFSVNTKNLRGLCRHIIVKPTTETTTYDIKITNPSNSLIYERTSETGTLSELLSLPVNGIYTLQLLNSSVDENFIIQLIIEE